MHITHITKTSLMTAIVILFILTNTCAATPPSSSLDSGTVVVEASGNVPGFTETQLATYLARRMHEETADPWQFSAGKPGAAPAPNGVVWSFKTLRVEWKAGSHRGFPSPEHWAVYLSAEVKLYLKNTYQKTTLAESTISGETEDKVLSEMVHNVAHILFVETNPICHEDRCVYEALLTQMGRLGTVADQAESYWGCNTDVKGELIVRQVVVIGLWVSV